MFALPTAVTLGAVSPPMVVLLVIVTAAYYKRVHTLKDSRRAVSVARQISFGFAVFLLLAEPLSPIGAWDGRSFTAHMMEHLIIGDIASLLMVLGLTGPLIQPLLKNPAIAALRPLTHPIAALIFWVVNMYFWHLPFAMEGALNNDTVHVIQHLLFFSVGFNMWMALFGPLPQPEWFGNIAKLVYIVAVRIAGLILGNFFIFSGSVFYSTYTTTNNPFGLQPLADQSVAGAVMMGEGTLLIFILLGWLFFKASSEGEESQKLIEYASEYGVELSQARSDRAAAAGTTDVLRERIRTGAPLDKGKPADLS